MSRTVTALYDTRAEAEAARQRLSSAVDVEKARIIDQDARNAGQSGRNSLNSIHMSHEDRHAYGEGLRRGGFLLCAQVDGDEDAEKIVRILEETASVDLDDRQQSWKSEGWSPYSASSALGTSPSATARTEGPTVQEEHIPIVEEELRVGKRVVERGGARVRTYIREVPVHEQITLREEHVQVERRPVEQPVSTATLNSADLLQERVVEMRETVEEAVVQKVASVREEVVIKKTAEERTEQIDDTVRRTEVDVDQGGRTDGDRSAFGSFGGGQKDPSTPNTSRSEFERDKSR